MMMKLELTVQKIPVKTAMAQDLTGAARTSESQSKTKLVNVYSCQ